MTGRHRCTAGKAVGRKAHDGSLPEPAFLVHGKQFDLHAAVLLGGHQDQILTAAAGDVLHQILLVGLLQNGGELPVVVGIHGQIVVALCGHITHHQLAVIPCAELGQPHVLHRIGQTLHALAHLPRSGVIPLQNGNAHVRALGRGVQHGCILLAVAVQVLQKKR